MSPHWPRWRVPLLGLLAIVLAIVSQIAVGSVIWPDSVSLRRLAALDAVSVLCQGSHPTSLPHAPAHRAADPSLCPPAASFAIPLAVLASGALPPPPPPPLPWRIGLASRSRALPARAIGAAFPRGPPALA